MAPETRLEAGISRALGDVLRAQRLKKRLSQEDVAHRAGINRRHYQLMESGLSDRQSKRPANPRLGTVLALADALEIEVEELIRMMLVESKPGASTANQFQKD